MFGWFSKRSRATPATLTQPPAEKLPPPVMREIPRPPQAAPPPAAAPPATPARPAVPPGSAPATHDVLVAQMRNHDADVRVAAARELGRRGDPAAVPALIAALHDPHPAVRIATSHALGKLRDERAVESLARAMSSDSDGNVQAAARGALQAIGTEAADRAVAADDEARQRAEREAQDLANPTMDRTRGIDGLIDALRGPHERLHAEAAAALAEAGPAAVEPLAHLLRDPNVWTRTRAAELLGRIGDARAIEPLQAALNHMSPEDRSIETYQFRDALRRALTAVSAACGFADGHGAVRK